MIIIDGLTKVCRSRRVVCYVNIHYFPELASPRLANLLGRWSEEFGDCAFSIRLVPRRRGKPPVRFNMSTSYIRSHHHPRMQLAAISLLEPSRVALEKVHVPAVYIGFTCNPT